MPDKMDPRLEDAMDRLGGKIGNLDFLRGVPSMKGHLVPSVSLGMRRRLSAGEKYAITLGCEFFETDDVIVRTSDPDDFWGLIDAMPTKIGKRHDVDRLIEEVRERCRDPRIVGYSIKEGGHYDPNRVTTSVAPLINGPRGLATEHPNLPGVLCVDLVHDDIARADDSKTSGSSEDAHSSNASYVSVDFLGDDPLHIYGNHYDPSTEARNGLDISRLVRSSNAYSDSVALQYEYGLWKNYSFLYQVKGFARRNDTKLSPEDIREVFEMERAMDFSENIRKGFRNFGITPNDGLVLPCVAGKSRQAFRSFEAKRPGVPYAFHLDIDGLTSPLRIEDFPQGMRAYLPMPKPPLAHQNTRLAQSCLNRAGVAFLNTPYVMNCRDAEYVRVISDGLHASVEEVMSG